MELTELEWYKDSVVERHEDGVELTALEWYKDSVVERHTALALLGGIE